MSVYTVYKYAYMIFVSFYTMCIYHDMCIYIYTRPGRMCCPGKCVLTAQGQSSMHFGMSANLQLGWRDLFPKHKTLNPNPKSSTLNLTWNPTYALKENRGKNKTVEKPWKNLEKLIKSLKSWSHDKPSGGTPGLGVFTLYIYSASCIVYSR